MELAVLLALDFPVLLRFNASHFSLVESPVTPYMIAYPLRETILLFQPDASDVVVTD